MYFKLIDSFSNPVDFSMAEARPRTPSLVIDKLLREKNNSILIKNYSKSLVTQTYENFTLNIIPNASSSLADQAVPL